MKRAEYDKINQRGIRNKDQKVFPFPGQFYRKKLWYVQKINPDYPSCHYASEASAHIS